MEKSHDYAAGRDRHEKQLDERANDNRPPLTGFSKELFDCFKSADMNAQLEALSHLQDKLTAKAAGIL